MENKLVYTVTELTLQIKDSLETLFPNIWVEGEISNLRIPTSGHYYFTLKDSYSQIRAVMFRSQQRVIQFTPDDGLNVICRGRVNVYEPRGEYQLLVEMMEPKGKGALQLAFEQLKQRLHAEGLFDEQRKKPLPRFPERIAIITSPTGAAVRDVLKIINRRFPNLRILIVPVTVQGDEAPREIIAAIEKVNALQEAEVIILARGGGSLEDLWAFNNEQVARAIVNSSIPIISAVGHEIDFTIADFVADLRAPTPSAAAEMVVKDRQELMQQIGHYEIRLRNALANFLGKAKNNVQYLYRQLQDPAKKILTFQIALDEVYSQLVKVIPRVIKQTRAVVSHHSDILVMKSPMTAMEIKRTRLYYLKNVILSQVRITEERSSTFLKSCIERLNALSPLNILNRGYSITRLLPSGRIVKNAGELNVGDEVAVRFGQGEASCIVNKVVLY